MAFYVLHKTIKKDSIIEKHFPNGNLFLKCYRTSALARTLCPMLLGGDNFTVLGDSRNFPVFMQ